jgi:hypothetical protein
MHLKGSKGLNLQHSNTFILPVDAFLAKYTNFAHHDYNDSLVTVILCGLCYFQPFINNHHNKNSIPFNDLIPYKTLRLYTSQVCMTIILVVDDVELIRTKMEFHKN